MSEQTPALEQTPAEDVPAEVLEDQAADEVAEGEPEGVDQLGDAGKKALDTMKGKWHSEREKRRQLEAQLAELNKPEQGEAPDVEQIRAQARAEAKAEALRERALDRLEAKAARKFTNPELARKLLADRVDDFVDDGNVDTDAITDALDSLLQSDPYLAAQGGTKRFQGTADSGARKGSARPAQLSATDVKRLRAEGKHAEIIKAREEGRLEDYLNT
jgi:hypothetical protein